jgi:hypothetical protein
MKGIQAYSNEKTFGPKTDAVKSGWRKLYKEECNDLYSLPNIMIN